MRRKIGDLTGQKFGRWIVKGRFWRKSRWGYHCICECGNAAKVEQSNLIYGKSKSCGCLASEMTTLRSTKHGLRQTLEYGAWCTMHSRCRNPNFPKYKDYGGRGIMVCKRWGKFEDFIKDMGRRPTPKHSVGRIDNDGPYSPENCRWETQREQGRNRRNNVWMTLNGVTKTQTEWAAHFKTSHQLYSDRLKAGWTDEEALSLPKYSRKPPRP